MKMCSFADKEIRWVRFQTVVRVLCWSLGRWVSVVSTLPDRRPCNPNSTEVGAKILLSTASWPAQGRAKSAAESKSGVLSLGVRPPCREADISSVSIVEIKCLELYLRFPICVQYVMLNYKRQQLCLLPYHLLNTLRTGLLNCLNARSRGLIFRHRASCLYRDRRFATLQTTLFIYLINKYISLSDICLTVHHWYK